LSDRKAACSPPTPTANTVLRSYAIKGSPHRRLLLEEIYYALGMSIPFFASLLPVIEFMNCFPFFCRGPVSLTPI
jgi:hypothetical protein